MWDYELSSMYFYNIMIIGNGIDTYSIILCSKNKYSSKEFSELWVKAVNKTFNTYQECSLCDCDEKIMYTIDGIDEVLFTLEEYGIKEVDTELAYEIDIDENYVERI